jgi:hypothetical protein
MSPRLLQYRTLWRAAMAQSGARTNVLLAWVLAVATVLAIAAGLVLGGEARVWAWCTPFAVVLLAWGGSFVRGAARLNTPAHAKLVPQMRNRLIELGFGTWFLCLAAIAACPFADTRGMVYAVIWGGLLTLGMGLSGAGHGGGLALIFGAVFMPSTRRWLPWLQEAASSPLCLAAVVALLAPAGLAVARAMFPQGGERHWRMQARRERWVSARPVDRGNHPWLKLSKAWYAAVLRRDSARRNARSLLLHALGLGPGHADFRGASLLTFVLGLIVLGLVRLGGSASVLEASADLGWVLASLLLLMPAVQAEIPLRAMPGTASEQSLLRLAPLMPGAAPAFNRLLGRALLVRALGDWALVSLFAFTLTWLSGASASTLMLQACLCCMGLSMTVTGLGDHARRRPLRGPLRLVLGAGAVLLCTVGGFALRTAYGIPAMPAATLIALALTAVLAMARWRSMVQAPFAFPAGRMD